MALIDGIEFDLTKLQPTVQRTNVRNAVPAANHFVLTNMGFGGMSLVVEGHVETESDFDDVLKAFLSDGEKALVTDSGYEYRVHIDKGNPKNRINEDMRGRYPFSFNLISEYPYKFTTAQTTRSKTITADGQTWSADDSSNSISTSGHVPAVPDIVVTGGTAAGFTRTGVLNEETDATEYSEGTSTYVLHRTFTIAAEANVQYNLQEVACDLWWEGSLGCTAYCKVTYEINGGGEVDLVEWSSTSEDTPEAKSYTCDVLTAANQPIVVRYYLKHSGAYSTHMQNAYHKTQEFLMAACNDVSITNTDHDETTCVVSNNILDGQVVRINADNTGHIDFADDFTDDRYASTCWYMSGVTRDAVNNKLDVATDGYIRYQLDTKYPITGIPTLTALVNVTTGTPTIQIAEDDGTGLPDTWYDIDQSVVDGISTEYKLRSRANDFKFKGKTATFIKFDFTGASGSIESIDIDIDTFTLDAAKLQIGTDGANEFQVDFGTGSSANCTISLNYSDRKYVA